MAWYISLCPELYRVSGPDCTTIPMHCRYSAVSSFSIDLTHKWRCISLHLTSDLFVIFSYLSVSWRREGAEGGSPGGWRHMRKHAGQLTDSKPPFLVCLFCRCLIYKATSTKVFKSDLVLPSLFKQVQGVLSPLKIMETAFLCRAR